MINSRYIVTALATALTFSVLSPALAQTGWNRKVEAISILPASGGLQTIRAYFSVQADEPSAPMDLSTEILILRNGSPIDIQQVAVDANPGSYPGCGVGCLTQQACICCEISPGNVVCTCGGLVANVPTEASLQPEDEIMVLLRPSPGALPEQDETDDQFIIDYHGDPIYWNRRIADVAVQPTPGAPSGFFDVFVDVVVEGNYDGPLALASELELQINGTVVASTPVPGLDFDLGWNQCSNQPCDDTVACVIDPSGPYYGTCQEDDDGPFSCSCQYHPVPDEVAPFLAVPIEPDDELTIILKPVPGALPELPGFEEDDEQTEPLCPADLTGDALVDAADLALLLGAWGPNAGHPADLNQDGMVDAADLALLLGSWGTCFPV